MNKAIFLSLLTTLGGVAAVSAQPPASGRATCGHGHHAQRFEKLDANKDGSVSRDEMLGEATARFDGSDANKDGKLTQPELEALHEKLARRFAKRHARGDGEKTRTELVAHVNARFDKLDADGNGALSQEELGKGRFKGRFGR